MISRKSRDPILTVATSSQPPPGLPFQFDQIGDEGAPLNLHSPQSSVA